MASPENLLKEFELMISPQEDLINEPDHHPSGESDPYFIGLCLEVAYKLLLRWPNSYQERLWEYCFAILGQSATMQYMTDVTNLRKVDNVHENLRMLYEQHETRVDASEASRLIKRLFAFDRSFYGEARTLLVELIKTELKNLPHTTDSFVGQRLAELGRTFDLSADELKITALLALKDSNHMVDDVLTKEWDVREMDKAREVYRIIFGKSLAEVLRLISNEGKLLKSGIIEYSTKRCSRTIDLNSSIIRYLNGLDSCKLTDQFFKKHDASTLSLSLRDHLLEELDQKLLLGLLQRSGGTNVLFHGAPGTGKTEFVKSLAHELGMELYFVAASEEDDDSNSQASGFRRIALMAAQNILDLKKSLIVVDEADSLLNLEDTAHLTTQHTDKSWLNMFLENSGAKIIWISNKYNRIESSTKRRFNFVLEFEDLNLEKRVRIWENQCRLLGISSLSTQDIQKLAAKYSINAGPIAMALKDVNQLVKDGIIIQAGFMIALEGILKKHQDAVGTKKNDLNPIPKAYLPEFINTSVDPKLLMKGLQGFKTRLLAKTLPEDFRNYNLLFFGPPGTGKTEFAKYLGQELAMGLITMRASDLLSMYVGECEKNIAKAFKKAETQNAILFLDECDSLFIDRSGAKQSYEVSRTNELLVAMENFKGILICSTNFREGLDEAAGRRFAQKVHFDFMRKEAKVPFFEAYFGMKLATEHEKELLEEIPNLTPGDFKTIRSRKLLEGYSSTMELIELLEKEVQFKKVAQKKIGLTLKGFERT